MSTIVGSGAVSDNIDEMVQIVRTDVYERWARKLKDRNAVARLSVAIRKLSLGKFGDVKSVGGGVSEVRIDHGPGYRLYFTRRQSGEIVILLCGGTKQKTVSIAMAGKIELKPWDVTEYLDSEEMIAEYLAVVFEEGDAELIRVALNDVARARGMSDLQRQTGLSRSALYKALGEGGNPTLDTLLAILKALGVKMSVVG